MTETMPLMQRYYDDGIQRYYDASPPLIQQHCDAKLLSREKLRWVHNELTEMSKPEEIPEATEYFKDFAGHLNATMGIKFNRYSFPNREGHACILNDQWVINLMKEQESESVERRANNPNLVDEKIHWIMNYRNETESESPKKLEKPYQISEVFKNQPTVLTKGDIDKAMESLGCGGYHPVGDGTTWVHNKTGAIWDDR